MAQVSDLRRRDCLVWETERPLFDVPRKSSNFLLLGCEWNFKMTAFSYSSKGYQILLRKVADKHQWKSFTVTTYVRGKTGDACLCNTVRCCSAEQVLWYCSLDSADKALCSDIHYGKWTIVFIFHCDQLLTLHLSRRETELYQNKCVQASSNIPPDLESLSSDISQLLESEIFPDVKLRCGDRSVSAHRSILAARSEVFTAMFRNKMAESETGTVDVTDVDSETLDLLLQYVYSGKTPDLTEDTASSLYEAGDKFFIPALKKSCADYIARNLTVENCLGYLLVADTHSDDDFKERMLDFAAENLESIRRDDWFKFNKDCPWLANSVYQRRFASALEKQT